MGELWCSTLYVHIVRSYFPSHCLPTSITVSQLNGCTANKQIDRQTLKMENNCLTLHPWNFLQFPFLSWQLYLVECFGYSTSWFCFSKSWSLFNYSRNHSHLRLPASHTSQRILYKSPIIAVPSWVKNDLGLFNSIQV